MGDSRKALYDDYEEYEYMAKERGIEPKPMWGKGSSWLDDLWDWKEEDDITEEEI